MSIFAVTDSSLQSLLGAQLQYVDVIAAHCETTSGCECLSLLPCSQTCCMRARQWERKFLAAQLKLDFDDEEREELFLTWNVHRESKERKMQLVRKLWAPDQTRSVGSASSPSFLAAAYSWCSEVSICRQLHCPADVLVLCDQRGKAA